LHPQAGGDGCVDTGPGAYKCPLGLEHTGPGSHDTFQAFLVGLRCRSRLFLIRRRLRLVFRSDFVMPISQFALRLSDM